MLQNPVYTIVIPTYNHLEDLLKPCIESIITNTDLSNVEVIVVANGCTDDTQSYVNSLGEPFSLLWFDEPLGYTKATNEGIKKAKGKYVILLNNDVQLLDWQTKNSWIELLRKPFDEKNFVGITGIHTLRNEVINRYFLVFFCVMIYRNVFDEIGLLDEIFSPGYGEDIDFCIKAERAGYHVVNITQESGETEYATNYPIYHIAEGTMHSDDNVYYSKWNEITKRNDEILRQRYCSDTPKYSIIIPTMDISSEMFATTILSMQKYTTMMDVQLIIIDNNYGATNRPLPYIESFSTDIKQFDQPIGYPKAINEGIKLAKGEYVVFLNDDIVFTDQPMNEWLHLLSNPFVKDETVGMVGLKKLGSDFSNGDYLMFFCVMTKKSIIKKVGMLDEKFSPGFVEDDDYCYRIKKLGYKLIQNPQDTDQNIFVQLVHDSGTTFGGYDNNKMLIKKNLHYLLDKHFPNDVVNIVVPTYNRYETLRRTLQSIEDQTYRKIRVWVSSDGHNEKTKEIVNEFNFKSEYKEYNYIHIQEHEGSLGSKPRIFAIEAMKDSGYVCFVDDDNIIYPTYVEKLINAIKQNDAIISYCQIIHSHIDGPIPTTEGFRYGEVDSLNYMVSTMIAKRCRNKWQHPKGRELITHDFDFINECSKYGTRVFVKEVLGEHGWTETGYIESDNIKIEKENVMKLNLGCGPDILEGYVNVDLYNPKADVQADAIDLPFDDQSVDEIYSSYLIEHLGYHGARDALHEWNRVLKEGGKLTIECPDLGKLINLYTHLQPHERVLVYGGIFGFDWIPGAQHKFTFDVDQMIMMLEGEGFGDFYFEQPTRYNEYDVNMRITMTKKYHRRMVYDTFLFHDELDMLELRLKQHDQFVDKFVIVEARETHQGKPKELVFEKNRLRFNELYHKIIYLVVDKFPTFDDEYGKLYLQQNKQLHHYEQFKENWLRERYQRDFISSVLKKCQDDDIIIHGDVDEILSDHAFKSYDPSMGLTKLEMNMYYYNFNCKIDVIWPKASIFNYGFIRNRLLSDVRFELDYETQSIIQNAGWHFSYAGGIDLMISKIESYAHEELNNDLYKNRERLKEVINKGVDLFDRNHNMHYVDIDDTYPNYIKNNIQMWKDRGFIYNPNEIQMFDHNAMKLTDEMTYNGIFVENEYGIDNNELKNKTVVDIGANNGLFTLRAIEAGAKQVHSYEPQGQSFNNLVNNTKQFNNVHHFKEAVFDSSINEITISNVGVLANVFEGDPNTSETVKCISLQDVVNRCGDEQDLVLKIDAEGSEYETFYGASRDVVRRFKTIYMEIHDWIAPHIDESDKLLSYITNYGFEISYKHPIIGMWYTFEDGTKTWEPGKNITLKLTRVDKGEVYDCFMFNDELDILDIRLDELNDVVDKFVLVEATLTHSGKPKPLYFNRNKQKYQKYLDKIIHIIVDDFPETEDPWVRERYQREQISKGLANCNDNDIILTGDADEIPRKHIVESYRTEQGLIGLELDYSFYYLNCVRQKKGTTHYRISPYSIIKETGHCNARYAEVPLIKDAGWHFSFIGDINQIIKKFESYAHQEYNNDYWKDPARLQSLIDNAGDILEKGMEFKYVDIDITFPRYVVNNIEYFKNAKLIRG